MKLKTTFVTTSPVLMFTVTVKTDLAEDARTELFNPGFDLSGYASNLTSGGNKSAERSWGGGGGGNCFFRRKLQMAQSVERS